MKIVIIVGIACLGFILLAIAVYSLINKTNGQIETSGRNRKYLLHVPADLDPNQPVPLVISLHGFIEWPAHQAHISRWNQVADEQGFIAVYPQGTGFPLRWNAYGWTGESEMEEDVQFINDLIDHLQSEYNIDSSRIYVNGLSNGAGMSYVLACKLAGRIAAMGGVAGAYSLPAEKCDPSRPVPVIAFHGTEDPIVPYEGGLVRREGLALPSIREWVQSWAERNGCRLVPLDLPTTGNVSGIHYPGCLDHADVMFYTIKGGGHTWPGGNPLPRWLTGTTSQEIDASRVMWEFFEQHPLP